MDVDTGLLRQTALFQGMEDGAIRRLLDSVRYGVTGGVNFYGTPGTPYPWRVSCWTAV